MIQIQTIGVNDKAVRTQITLTENLKSLVTDMANERGESLSEYLRRAAIIKILLDKQEKEDLGILANSLIGSIKAENHPNWKTKADIYKWSRKIREEW
jgi:hypothetical protein